MKYALNLADDKRILSACVVLPNGNYDGMPITDTIPDDNVSDYLYSNGEYVYEPLPAPDPVEPTPTPEERIAALEEKNAQLEEALALLLSGATEEVTTDA